MDNTIYIILGALVVVYFLTKVLNRKHSKDRKSRRFMEGHKMDERKKATRDGQSKE